MTTSDDFGSEPLIPSEETPSSGMESETREFLEDSDSAGLPDLFSAIANVNGSVMLIGGTDTGKTTFGAAVAKTAYAAGRRVAVVDADSGQSEIGPPGTLGLGVPEAPFSRLSDLKPRALAFIGSTSPPGFLLEWVIGVRHLTDRAHELGAEIILVDMPGLVSGTVGCRLQQVVAEAIHPAAYVLFERNKELRTLRRGLPPGRLYRPALSPKAHAKSPTVRALRRSKRFAEYFHEAEEWELPVDQRIVRGGTLFLGRPLRPAALESLQQNLTVRLVHVERGIDGVRVITAGPASPVDRTALARRLGSQKLIWLEAQRLTGLLVGLLDRWGETVAVGCIKRVDFRRRILKIVTPWLDPEAIGGFVWGVARTNPLGKEYPPLKRGEV
jgi:polynucleotide 5'-hydroxyl-kinase GRC3/NOL9